jgi:DNA mismatch repair ATPase MutS
MAVDRWHQRHRAAVLEWLRRAGEIEALAALATFSYEHPDDPVPSVVVDARAFEAVGLAHPLMPEAAAVRNDVMLGRSHPRVLIVSGSNMSGKSTLLRAVGVNVVLALAGATVRATQLTVSPLALGATIRVDDSLQEGRSRFYAEILRIRDIVSRASIEPTLFLLDEILHGTNSYDRRIGAEAIVTALVSRGAIGLVTTHDLALTELVDRLDGAAANVHFEDRLDQGRMAFDYRMRPGVVTHSNALALMRAIGLDV